MVKSHQLYLLRRSWELDPLRTFDIVEPIFTTEKDHIGWRSLTSGRLEASYEEDEIQEMPHRWASLQSPEVVEALESTDFLYEMEKESPFRFQISWQGPSRPILTVNGIRVEQLNHGQMMGHGKILAFYRRTRESGRDQEMIIFSRESLELEMPGATIKDLSKDSSFRVDGL